MDELIDTQNTKPLISEGLYLLQEERFIESNKNIYKIGRSSNIYNRINSYENGTIVYLIIECNNSEKNEAELIKIFNKEFKNIKYYGSEYFQGELLIMKNLIINHIKKNASDDINLIDMDIKITTVDKETDLHIPKYKQEIYSKAKLSIIKIGEDLERHNNICKIKTEFINNEKDNDIDNVNINLFSKVLDTVLDKVIDKVAYIFEKKTFINEANNNLVERKSIIIQNANNNSERPTLRLGLINRNINIPEFEFDEVNNRIILPSTTTSNSNNTISNSISNGSIVNTSNTSNTSNSIVNSNNVTNNITNNIYEKVPFVYPFEYENISFLSEEELLEILKSSNGANLVLEKIYSNIENMILTNYNNKNVI